ncbi:hypothetical protein LIER_36938 [Lithospermum erythrorhizon]|uniref:Uncharacterized protein n=1 Tax=Lithospermum erythrorhizon TaxID=34254 RepID=A0AAV3PES7_LITER
MTMTSGKLIDTGAHGDKKSKATHEAVSLDEEKIKEVVKPYVSPLPFPKRLLRSKMVKSFSEHYDKLSKVDVNLPLLNVLKNIPAYATFIKELIGKRRKYERWKMLSLEES